MFGGIRKYLQKVVYEKKAWLDMASCRAVRGKETMQEATAEDVGDAKSKYQRLKEMIKQKKEKQQDEFDKRLSEDFRTNKKFFWKSTRSVRVKTQHTELKPIRDQNEDVEKGERWKEYLLFEREEELTASSVMNVNQDSDVLEIVNASKMMKSGKAAG